MKIPEPYTISVSLLIVCGELFSALVLLHVCRDHGLYNQHKEVEGRRQNIHLPPREEKIPDLAKVQHIPLKAVKFEEISVAECH